MTGLTGEGDIVLPHGMYLLKDLEIGQQIGRGANCDVLEVSLATTTALSPLPAALKRVRFTSSTSDYVSRCVDLATEAALLSSLNHENIVRIYGVAAAVEGAPQQERKSSGRGLQSEGFAIVMERLEMTLEERLGQWREKEKGRGFIRKIRQTREEKLGQRLRAVMLPLASAVRYMHDQNLIHRDLKPANIGFDRQGNVKLFDLGFAVRSSSSSSTRGKAGTPRYMAPEMAQRKSYGKPVDVYAFGSLLWEVLTTNAPFEHYKSKDELMEWVVRDGERPRIPMWWPKTLKSLTKQCWSQEPSKRPTFEDITKSLSSLPIRAPA